MMEARKTHYDRLFQVYGPHISALYVRDKSLRTSVSSIVHHFLSPHVDDIGYKLQPQGPGYESVYASTGVNQYLLSLTPDNHLDATFNAIALHEQTLLEPLLDFLQEPKQWKRGVRIVGDEKLSLNRVPTVSFVVADDPPVKSSDIVKVFDDTGKVGSSSKPLCEKASLTFDRRSEFATGTSTPTLSLTSSGQRSTSMMVSSESRWCIPTPWRKCRLSLRL